MGVKRLIAKLVAGLVADDPHPEYSRLDLMDGLIRSDAEGAAPPPVPANTAALAVPVLAPVTRGPALARETFVPVGSVA